MRTALTLTAATLVWVTAGPKVVAEPITFMFSGEVAQVFDPTDLFDGAVNVGTPFSGSYTFESATPDVDPQPHIGRYTGAIIDLVGEVGGVAFDGPADSTNSIVVFDGGASSSGTDTYHFLTRVSVAAEILPFSIFFHDLDSVVFDSASLPMAPPELTQFETANLTIGSEDILVLSGGITQLTPEPSTLALIAIGGAAMATRSRTGRTGKRRRAA